VRIHIDAVDTFRPTEQVIESVTTRAGDRDNAIAGADVQRFMIERRIFPALVVDEIPAVNLVKKPLFHCPP
jgi:hypothetical protein